MAEDIDPGAQLAAAAPVFTALGDATRLRIVSRLSREGPLSIARLTSGTDMSRQAVSKHLRVLSNAGVARSRQDGRESIWQIDAGRIDEVRRYLDTISSQWDDALARLRSFVEAPLLQDVIAPGLSVLFCGSAGTPRLGAYYDEPGNAFWNALSASGLTPRQLPPEEYARLLQFRLGLTVLAQRIAGNDSMAGDRQFDRETLRRKILQFRPKIVAFTAKRPAREFLRRQVAYGLQKEKVGSSALFVLPSPSGNARRYWSMRPWRELARLVAAFHTSAA